MKTLIQNTFCEQNQPTYKNNNTVPEFVLQTSKRFWIISSSSTFTALESNGYWLLCCTLTLFSNSSCLCVSSRWTIKGPWNMESYTVLLAGAHDPLNFWNRSLGRFHFWLMLATDNAKKLAPIISLIHISLDQDSWRFFCPTFCSLLYRSLWPQRYSSIRIPMNLVRYSFLLQEQYVKFWKTTAESHNLHKKLWALEANATDSKIVARKISSCTVACGKLDFYCSGRNHEIWRVLNSNCSFIVTVFR